MKRKPMILLVGTLVAAVFGALGSVFVLKSGLPNAAEIAGVIAYGMLGVAALCFGLSVLLHARTMGSAPERTAALPVAMLTMALGVVHIGGNGLAVQITHFAAIGAALIVTILIAYLALTRRRT